MTRASSPKFTRQKQLGLIELLAASADVFAICKDIAKAEYFDPDLRKIVSFLHGYYDEYNALPSTRQILAETEIELNEYESLTTAEKEYCAAELEKFCQWRAVEIAIIKAANSLQTANAETDYGSIEQSIRDAINVSLNKDLGLEYFEDPVARLEKQLDQPARISTGWKDVDDVIGGGLARKELILFSANSGGGKSITMSNLGLNLLQTPKDPKVRNVKLNVLYISLELSEELIAQRYDTMLTGVSSAVWQVKYKEIASKVEEISGGVGKLTVKRMPSGTTSNQIRSYLKEFEMKHGYVPDVLVVDYLDLMGTNQHVAIDNVSIKDKYASEQLTDILHDYNMIGITASQQNRAAVSVDEADLNQGHIAGGLTKVMAVDWYVSIVLNDKLKSAGEIKFVFLKTRSSDGVGRRVTLAWDGPRLRINNLDYMNLDVIARRKAEAAKDPASMAIHKLTERGSQLENIFNIDK